MGQIERNIVDREPTWQLAHALDAIRDGTGDVCYYKAKQLAKFGRYASLGTSAETVQEHGGNETLLTDNLIDVVTSSDAGDNQLVAIEGHIIAGNDLTFVRQTVTLDGTNNAALTTPLARATRIENLGSTDFAGTVKVVDATTPSTIYVQATGVQANGRIYNRSQKCATTISSQDYYVIDALYGAALKKTSASVDFALQTRAVGGVWQERYAWEATAGSPGYPHRMEVPIIVSKNTDVRIVGVASTTGVEVVARMDGFLALIDTAATNALAQGNL